METGNQTQEQYPRETTMYMERFAHMPPAVAVGLCRELRRGSMHGQFPGAYLQQCFGQALELYPGYAATREQATPAAEILTEFAQSSDAADAETMLPALASLWVYDPQGASQVTKLCLVRKIRTPADASVYARASRMVHQAMEQGLWDDGPDVPGAIGHIAVERIRRRVAQAPDDSL